MQTNQKLWAELVSRVERENEVKIHTVFTPVIQMIEDRYQFIPYVIFDTGTGDRVMSVYHPSLNDYRVESLIIEANLQEYIKHSVIAAFEFEGKIKPEETVSIELDVIGCDICQVWTEYKIEDNKRISYTYYSMLSDTLDEISDWFNDHDLSANY